MADAFEPRSDQWVEYAQRVLKWCGYWDGGITGTSTSSLVDALKSFQKDHGLECDGVPRGDFWLAFLADAESGRVDVKLTPEETEPTVDWKSFPEFSSLQEFDDFDDYLKRSIAIDPGIFADEG
jgi:peptidoglycan hydrolase-like protein with peptidoglycan-binding domain